MCIGNIFDRSRIRAIVLVDNAIVINNTFIGKNLNSASTDQAIDINASTVENLTIINNHFQDYTGAGSVAVAASATLPTTRGTVLMIGGNSFYNVDTEYDSDIAACTVMDLTSTDITEGSDPLEDVATLNFRKKSTATSANPAFAFAGFLSTDTANGITTGAAQNEAGGGGGVAGGSFTFS
jgi:hypothetical protein